MTRIQIFWDTYPSIKAPAERRWEDEVRMKMGGSRMYREGDIVIFEHLDFDSEDGREYEYRGVFRVEDYRRAIEELQRTGRSRIEGRDETSYIKPAPDYSLTMVKKDDLIELKFSGSPGTDPGGRLILGTVSATCRVGDLLLKE